MLFFKETGKKERKIKKIKKTKTIFKIFSNMKSSIYSLICFQTQEIIGGINYILSVF